MLVLILAIAIPPPAAESAFPGRNGKIAFHRTLENGDENFRWVNDIFVAQADGTGEVNLTDGPADESIPEWSPDGSQIAYLHFSASFTINADGSGRNFLVSGGAPTWSPDGTRLAIARNTHQYWPYNMDIYTVGRDGGDLVNLINDPREGPWDGEPEWSPDGSRIAFLSDRDGGTVKLYTISPDGTGLRRLTRDRAGAPTWSPDGRQILFVRRLPYWGEENELWTIQADGTGERQLTHNSFGESSPAWSPDGTKILFDRWSGQTSDIWVMDADGTGERFLIEDGHDPDWQPIVNGAPECGAALASPPVLGKDRELAPVRIEHVTDPDGDDVTLRITGATQDERVTGPGDDTSPDAAETTGPGSVQIRAERNPHGDGRVYRIAFEAGDGNGGRCSGTVAVAVPRKKDSPALDSAPPSYDSFAP